MLIANLDQAANIDTTESNWKSLYKIAGVAVLIAVSLMVLDIISTILSKEVIENGTFTAIDWFTIYHNSWFSGLRNLGLFNVVEMTLTVPMFFALYLTHRHINITCAGLAMILYLAGMAIYISNNAAIPMFVLSGKYAAATDA